jgi:hypothetical protein
MEFLAAHAHDGFNLVCVTLSVFGGLWAASFRFRQLLKAEIQEYAASKSDLARIEGKLDLVVSALLVRGLKKEVQRNGL